jgi:hypothetical protein
VSFEQKQYWLKGVEYERERIIGLLEGLLGVYDQNPVTPDFGIKVCLSVIKG